jgi:hypothetical protein
MKPLTRAQMRRAAGFVFVRRRDDVGAWCVDEYDLRGKWRGTSYGFRPMTKSEALRFAKGLRRRLPSTLREVRRLCRQAKRTAHRPAGHDGEG